MADVPRAHWARLIAATLAVIAGGFALPYVLPTPVLQENRTLAPAPAWPKGPGDLTAFRKATDAWVADHFPARTQLIAGLNVLRYRLGVSGSPRVAVGRDGWLYSDDGSHMAAARGDTGLSEAQIRSWLYGLAGRTEALRAQGRAYVVLAPPMKEAVYPNHAPGWFRLDPNRPAEMLSRLAMASGAGEVIYPHPQLAQQAHWGLHVYDRYDTHWTGLGAYQGYAAFMRSLARQGLAEGPRPLGSFSERTDMPLSATPRDLSLMLGVASFVTPDFPQFSDPATAQGVRITYLSGHDWNGLRIIDTGQTGKPVLLMTVDSFSNALMPFLYGHFSRIVTAHNQDGFWRPDLIARFQPDIVAIEVLESGLPAVMGEASAPSAAATARIDEAVESRARYLSIARRQRYMGERNVINGGEGDDRLKGTRRPDDIQGRPGNDSIEGLGGDDVLRGGRGRDTVDGGAGDDWISGGRDNDVLRGGKGADVFNSFAESGTDVVLDFDAQEGDRVEINLGDAYRVRQNGADTIVELRGGRLVLRGVTLSHLPLGWIRNR
ncbi:hypothetical protein [Phenylobacterium sp.]|uniref:alginate O-acetyltransferase AlgX-related protein n=1 Tax=Phenylobacterium sp. TaxID=1871053 RepID=UPI0025FFB3E5|nr:hypothetical protein [Phenylobacterium sp.]